MKRKIVGIFVCMLLITTCVVPVMGEFISLKNEDKHLQKNNQDSYQKINDNVRSIAEFESVDELIITWPKWWNTHDDGFILHPYMIDLIKATEDVVRIRINIDNPIIKLGILSKLTKAGVPTDNITFTRIRTNDIWIRDYGPFFVEKNDELAIVDFNYFGWRFRPLDNLYPTLYGRITNIDYSFYTNFLLCLQGGNYMTDGKGQAMIADKPLHMFGNRFLTNEEIKDRLKSYLGLDEVYIFKSQKDPTGQIANFAKLVDEKTVLVGAWEPTDENYQICEDNAINFSHLGFNVIRIPMLRNSSSEEKTIWTYTNALIINGTHKKVVLVPLYDMPEDSVAISIYQQVMPEYEIRGIDYGRILAPNYGTIFCTSITRPLV